MGRPKTISDETILDAARALFHERGFSATTAQIAKRAGVSEGSVFRRFQSKEYLFRAAMGIPDPEWIQMLDPSPIDDFWGHMETLSHQILRFMEDAIPKIVILATVQAEFDIPNDAPPISGQKKIIRFFEYHIDKSPYFERADEAARIFFGALHSFAFANYIGFHKAFKSDRNEYVDTLLWMMRGTEDDV